MKIYLAGPMSGIPDYNFPAFFRKAEELRAEGHTVFNPAEADLEEWGDLATVKKKATYKATLKKDLNWILDEAEAIYLLPGWEQSKGVKVEYALAECLKLRILE